MFSHLRLSRPRCSFHRVAESSNVKLASLQHFDVEQEELNLIAINNVKIVHLNIELNVFKKFKSITNHWFSDRTGDL